MNRKHLFQFTIITMLVMFVAVAVASASQDGATKDWKFHTIVDVDFIKQYVKVPPRDDVIIIDSRPKRAKYDKGHIPGAISIPDRKFDTLKGALPENKDTLLIFYCGGLKCKLSHKSAYKAEKLGYKNIKVYADGFPKWMKQPGHYAEVSTDYVKKMTDQKKDMLLVDSRPKRKRYDKGHIPGAISIPDSKFNKMTDQLPGDKEKLLVFYCGGYKCKLSHKSAKKAIDLGYKNVKVFSAGYPAWKKMMAAAGTPASKKAAPQIKAGSEEGSIDIANFEKIIKDNPKSIMLIDVRDRDEFETGSFKTAINMPVDDLEKEIKTLSNGKPIIFVCSTGARSGESYYMVKDMRADIKDVYYLEAEISFNKDGSSYELKATQ